MKDEMIVIKILNNETDAEITRGRLVSEGIEAIITKDDVGGMYPSLQQTGGVKLLVRKEDEDKAREILEEE